MVHFKGFNTNLKIKGFTWFSCHGRWRHVPTSLSDLALYSTEMIVEALIRVGDILSDSQKATIRIQRQLHQTAIQLAVRFGQPELQRVNLGLEQLLQVLRVIARRLEHALEKILQLLLRIEQVDRFLARFQQTQHLEFEFEFIIVYFKLFFL